jgi:hypothetical protein
MFGWEPPRSGLVQYNLKDNIIPVRLLNRIEGKAEWLESRLTCNHD